MAPLTSRARRAAGDYGARLREFSPNARLFLAAATLGGLNAGVSSVLLNLYVLSLGYGEAFLGRLLSVGSLAALPAALVAGPLIDRWGGKRAMLGGTALAGGGALALLVSPAPGALRAGVALASMGSVLVYIAYAPFLARYSSARERMHLFGVAAAAYVVSTASGSALGGFLPRIVAGAWAGASQAEVYRLALFGGALLSALAIPLLALVRESPAASPAPAGRRRLGADLLAALRANAPVSTWGRRRQVPWLVAQFVIADGLIRLGANLVVPFFNVLFVRHLGASEAWYGTLRLVERALEVAAMLLVAPLAARFGPVATITATQLLSVPLLLALGFAPTVAIASSAFLFRGTLMEMTVPIRDAFMMEVVPEQLRATATAALLLAGYAIAFVSTRAGGVLLESGHSGLAYTLTAVLYAASAALYWRFFSAKPQAAPKRKADLAALASEASR